MQKPQVVYLQRPGRLISASPDSPRWAQLLRPPPSKQPAAVGNAWGRGGCRARARGRRVGAGTAFPTSPVRPPATTPARTPLPRAPGARSHVWPQLPMATGRWYTSRQMGQLNCASRPLSPPAGPAGGCRCCAEATRLRNIAIPGAGRRHRPLSKPADPASLPRRRRAGVTAQPPIPVASRQRPLGGDGVSARRLPTQAGGTQPLHVSGR